MSGIANLLVLLAVLTFVLAVVGAWSGAMMGIGAEALRNLSTTMGHSTGLIREQCPVW